jgi:hypothetical protein
MNYNAPKSWILIILNPKCTKTYLHASVVSTIFWGYTQTPLVGRDKPSLHPPLAWPTASSPHLHSLRENFGHPHCSKHYCTTDYEEQVKSR